MATIKIERGSAVVTMDNGAVIPVRGDYTSIAVHSGASPYLITFSNGEEWWFTGYRPELIDGLVGDIADGETFTPNDCTWVRYGDEMLSMAPGPVLKVAA